MSTDKITFLTNWHATPYHAPLYLAQARGYFQEEGIKVALLEPNDPSDVTEIIGSGKVDLGFKAMIHTLAVRTSILENEHVFQQWSRQMLTLLTG
ncbi:thiamine biosynthesis protein [Coccidioides immitis RMSCC 3703]|uniref:4-amino-5-hydroxymethyl-2-methylpyrimidine phosphate synthase n=1 Tax=Coccidioides immitis RMSCC 3703 TaxID=454286 RepID=A0A0J8R7Q3_COCIT|nr:thiamine biosynthesis protein [Coccidioides immitis RMSCC 3703]